jgi:hypothetical protein
MFLSPVLASFGDIVDRKKHLNRVSQAPQGQTHTQQPTPTPTFDTISPEATDLLSQIVFSLLDVQSESWLLFLGRVNPNTPALASRSSMRKPALCIHIFHSIFLENAASAMQTYRLVKILKELRVWIDAELRMWWDRLLGIDGAGGDLKC